MHVYRYLLVASTIAVSLVIPSGASSRAATLGALPLPTVASTLASTPLNCPATTLIRLRPNGWYQAGRSPLVGFSAWATSQGHATLPFGTRGKYGYAQKIGWWITPGVGPIRLRGWNLRTRQPIWFGHPMLPNPDHHLIAWPAAILRLHHAPELAFIPAAGCYALLAQWNGGSWRITFGAGSTGGTTCIPTTGSPSVCRPTHTGGVFGSARASYKQHNSR